MNRGRAARSRAAGGQAGLSLIEVMISLAIGTVITLAVLIIMASNSRNLRLNEGLSESQENARMAFELIARDVRQARDTSCGPLPISNRAPISAWYTTPQPVLGFGGSDTSTAKAFGTSVGQRMNGTQALQLQGTAETLLIDEFPGSGDTITLMTAAAPLGNANGFVVVCDLTSASLHQVDSENGKDLNLQQSVIISDPDNPQFQVARYTAVTWYIGNNGRAGEGGRSLYRVRLNNAGVLLTEEILPGVVDMSLRYHREGDADFVGLADMAATDWERVNAIELTLTTETTQTHIATEAAAAAAGMASSDGEGRLRRTLTQVIALRGAET